GKDTKPFQLQGSLNEKGTKLALTIDGKPAGETTLAALQGNAAVGWQKVQAYGFDVGAAEMKATIGQGVVNLTPIDASFGGGKVRVQPTLFLNEQYDVTLAKGKVIDKAKLTPAALADALGYALPAIANAAQASGVISFDLDECRVPM